MFNTYVTCMYVFFIKEHRKKGKLDDKEDLIWIENTTAYGASAVAGDKAGELPTFFLFSIKVHIFLKTKTKHTHIPL